MSTNDVNISRLIRVGLTFIYLPEIFLLDKNTKNTSNNIIAAI